MGCPETLFHFGSDWLLTYVHSTAIDDECRTVTLRLMEYVRLLIFL